MWPHSCERGGRRGRREKAGKRRRKGQMRSTYKKNEFQRCTLPPTAPMTKYRNVLDGATPTDPSRDANMALKFRFSFLLPGGLPREL